MSSRQLQLSPQVCWAAVHQRALLKSPPHPSSGDPLLRSVSEKMSCLLPLDSIPMSP